MFRLPPRPAQWKTTPGRAARWRGFALGALLALVPADVRAVDVELFGVHKGQDYLQAGTGAPTLTNFFFTAFARAKSFNTLVHAAVRPVGGPDRPMAVGHDFDFYNFWSATDVYPTQGALDAVHPDTNYTVTLNTVNDGPVALTFSLTGGLYPNAPHIANYAAAQRVRADADFSLQWDAFSGGAAGDHIRVEIEDVSRNNNVPETGSPLGERIFRTGDPRDVASLDGTATSVVIPAGTLFPGHNYRARVRFTKLTGVDTNSYPQVTGVAGYVARTEFTLHTVDVRMAGMLKGQRLQQTDANAPASQGFGVQAFLDSRGTAVVASASLQLPGGGPTIDLPATNDFSFKDTSLTTSSQLDAAYPDGVYQLTVTTVDDGAKVFALPVTNVLAAMAGPHISNFAAAQAINPGLGFTLTWDALGGTTNDYVQLQVKLQTTNGNAEVFQTRPPRVPGALNGGDASATIPAFTLQPGTAYSATLMFAQLTGPLDTNSYPGAVAVAGCFKRLSFTLRTPDVRSYSITKRQEFFQTNSGPPVAFGPSNFLAIARVQTPGTNNVTSASFILPNSTVVPMDPTNDFKLKSVFADQATLDANIPPGAYQISVATVNDGNKTLGLNVPATAFPNVPQVNGYNLLQFLNPHRPQLITWNAFAGGTPGDHLRLEIVDTNHVNADGSTRTVFSSPRPGEIGALNGTNQGVVLLANTLQPGKDYLAQLFFVKVSVLDTASYPGSVGSAGFTSATFFNLHTRGSHPSAPLIGGIVRSNAQTFLSFFGETNRAHRVEVVSDLKLRNWLTLMTNGPAFDGSNGITDGSGGAVRFYRVTPLAP